ncbi:hypothetical protein Y032_0014g2392 [Ancylostoma ceylanicum]|uniref:Uncharacterized protein n=1 Tax=Ancylostoma ceylanicum TaxID=53326 RepID=A0A016V9W6_9BILA|nr:hypothetical protein Y032_0014g2392 [Ancylostoma ceylanicum]
MAYMAVSKNEIVRTAERKCSSVFYFVYATVCDIDYINRMRGERKRGKTGKKSGKILNYLHRSSSIGGYIMRAAKKCVKCTKSIYPPAMAKDTKSRIALTHETTERV